MKVVPVETVYDSDSSSSDEDQTLRRGHRKKKSTIEAKFDAKGEHAKRRQELRQLVVKDVLSAVMPDIGAYEIDGMAPKQEVRKGQMYEILKFLGLWSLSLHESVQNGSMYHFDRALKKIMGMDIPIFLLLYNFIVLRPWKRLESTTDKFIRRAWQDSSKFGCESFSNGHGY